jgi:hypothetical protein
MAAQQPGGWEEIVLERFASLTDKRGGAGECWPWRGSLNGKNGYGSFFPAGRRRVYAHRFAWEIVRGEIPPGLCVCHRCDNPRCCNPAHLFLGSRFVNALDMARKERGTSNRGRLPYGVQKPSNCRGYAAQIKHRGRRVYLGYYRTAEVAHVAAVLGKSALVGEGGGGR